jgi:hypothetical protein
MDAKAREGNAKADEMSTKARETDFISGAVVRSMGARRTPVDA